MNHQSEQERQAGHGEAGGHDHGCGAHDCGCHEPADEGALPRQEIDELKAQLGRAQDQYLRALAEYQNFQRRSLNNEREARVQGASDVVRTMVPILDHFALALGADPERATARTIIEGVAAIRDEMVKALGLHGVQVIGAAANDEFVPGRHEAVMQVFPGTPAADAASGIGAGRIVALLQPGYALGDRVLRPAKVSVMASSE